LTFPVGSAISQSLIRRFHQNDLLPISLPQKAISYQKLTAGLLRDEGISHPIVDLLVETISERVVGCKKKSVK
jgi:hypothetical protein